MTLRVLITGFGSFPGAPFNPTGSLVSRLTRLRRPALDGVERASHIFRVTYGDVDRDLPRLLEEHRPDVLLMFGLAARTPYVRSRPARATQSRRSGRTQATHASGSARSPPAARMH
jgi:pyroglutamyl-peptidase